MDFIAKLLHSDKLMSHELEIVRRFFKFYRFFIDLVVLNTSHTSLERIRVFHVLIYYFLWS